MTTQFTAKAPQGQTINLRRQKREAVGFDEEAGKPIYAWKDAEVATLTSNEAQFTIASGERFVVEGA